MCKVVNETFPCLRAQIIQPREGSDLRVGVRSACPKTQFSILEGREAGNKQIARAEVKNMLKRAKAIIRIAARPDRVKNMLHFGVALVGVD